MMIQQLLLIIGEYKKKRRYAGSLFSICLLFILDDRALGRRVEIADDDLKCKDFETRFEIEKLNENLSSNDLEILLSSFE